MEESNEGYDEPLYVVSTASESPVNDQVSVHVF